MISEKLFMVSLDSGEQLVQVQGIVYSWESVKVEITLLVSRRENMF